MAEPSARGMNRPEDGGYWRRTRRLTAVLLGVWLAVVLLATFFARDIDFAFPGGRFSFWLGAQGVLLVFLAIVVVYVRAMQRLEAEEAEVTEAAKRDTEPPAR
jgi:putative solute:sodium symporter small subunit